MPDVMKALCCLVFGLHQTILQYKFVCKALSDCSGFTGHLVLFTAVHLSHCNVRTATGDMQTNEWNSIPIKTFIYKSSQGAWGQIWPMDWSLPNTCSRSSIDPLANYI